MRTPAHIQQQARRGLQILQRNPLSVKAVQQPQGLHIVTVTTTSAQLTSASSTGLGLAAAERASWSENFFFRALTQLRDGISSIFPKATVVVTGAVAAQQMAPSPVLSEAALEPTLSSASMDSADLAMTEILTEASRTPQPLIFSAHNIESYIASRKLAKSSPRLMTSNTTPPAGETESTSTPYGAAAGLLHHIVRQYVLLPVATLNNKVMKTTQSTLGTITVAFKASSASEASDGRKRAQTNWVRVGLSFAAIVVAYDAAILAVTYAFML